MVLHLRAHPDARRPLHGSRPTCGTNGSKTRRAPRKASGIFPSSPYVAVQVERHVSLEHALAREARRSEPRPAAPQQGSPPPPDARAAGAACASAPSSCAVDSPLLLDALAVRVDVSVSRPADHGRGGRGVVAKNSRSASRASRHRRDRGDTRALRRGQLDDAPERWEPPRCPEGPSRPHRQAHVTYRLPLRRLGKGCLGSMTIGDMIGAMDRSYVCLICALSASVRSSLRKRVRPCSAGSSRWRRTHAPGAR